jgi:hypothetical protein
MSESIKIPIKLFTIPTQEIIEQKECYWELFPDRLVQRFHFLYESFKDEEDHSLGRERLVSNVTSWYKKDFIIGVEIIWQALNKTWKVAILLSQCESSSYFLFKEKRDAMQAFETIQNWLK